MRREWERHLRSRLATLQDERNSGSGGFTLIELLVVVVIIGILIAIAVPLYLNYRKSANDKAAQNDLRGALSMLEKCNGDNNKYPDAVPATGGSPTGDTCTAEKINLSAGSKLQYVAKSDKSAYIAWSRNDGGGKLYCYASEAGGAIKSTTATAFPTATYASSC